MVAHWREAAVDADVLPLKVDWAFYRAEERAGRFEGMALRRGRRIVGYNAFWLSPSRHHTMSAPWAVNDVIYIDPAERGLAAFLMAIREPEARYKARGSFQIIYMPPNLVRSPSRNGDARLAHALERLGYEEIGRTLRKRL